MSTGAFFRMARAMARRWPLAAGEAESLLAD